MPDALHVLLKWNAEFEPRTIERHREIAEKLDFVWWGRFRKSSSPGVADDKIAQLRSQIAAGVPTFVFLYPQGDAWRADLDDVTTDPNQVDREHLPAYYTSDQCNAFFRKSPTSNTSGLIG